MSKTVERQKQSDHLLMPRHDHFGDCFLCDGISVLWHVKRTKRQQKHERVEVGKVSVGFNIRKELTLML